MQRRAFSAPAVLAVPILLGLVALATRPLASSSVPALTPPEWVGVAADTMLQTLVMVLLVAAVAATVINVWAVLPLPRGSPRPRPLIASLAVYLYFAVAIAILVLRVRLRPLPPRSSTTSGLPGLAQATNHPVTSGITWIAVLAALVILTLAALLLLRWLHSLAGPSAAVPSLSRDAFARDRLVSAIGESIDALRAEPDPRRAVIAAYARPEAELEAIGCPRRPAEAPLEYMARILGGTEAPSLQHPHPALPPRGGGLTHAGALRRLIDLFEWGRFSQHPVGPGMKEEAIEALVQVRAGLGRP